MASLNRVTLIGRLGKDPDFKTLATGTALSRLSVATMDKWTDKDGNKKEQTDWHIVVAWGKLAEISKEYLAKGNQVYVEGKLKTRSWENDGQTKYFTEVIASDIRNLTSRGSSLNFSDGIGSAPREREENEKLF